MPKGKKIALHHPKLKRDHEVESNRVAELYKARGWQRKSGVTAASTAKSGEGDK